MPRQVIKIMPGDELKVKTESIDEFKGSIFADVYAMFGVKP